MKSQKQGVPNLDLAVHIISTFLSRQTEPCTEKQLFRKVPGRKQHKVSALRTLVKSGEIIRCGSGKKGDPFVYALKNAEPNVTLDPVFDEVII